MRTSPHSTLVAVWNDPFRLVLVISLVALVGWVAAHSGAQDAPASRVRAGDVDAGESSAILVSVDDSPFDLPFDDLVAETAPPRSEASAAPSDDAARTGSTRHTTGAGGATPQPSTDGGGSPQPPTDTGGSGSTPPATDGTSQAGTGVGPGAAGPIIDPDPSGTPELPGVELPVPALPNPTGSTGSALAGTTPEAPLQLRSVTSLAPVAPPVVDPLVDPLDATFAALLG